MMCYLFEQTTLAVLPLQALSWTVVVHVDVILEQTLSEHVVRRHRQSSPARLQTAAVAAASDVVVAALAAAALRRRHRQPTSCKLI